MSEPTNEELAAELEGWIRSVVSPRGKVLFSEAAIRLREQAVPVYCPTCESCGEGGCCNPGGCIAVMCLYGANSVEAYAELLEENERLRDQASAN